MAALLFLAVGLVLISAMSWLQVDLMHLLTGEILAVSVSDLVVIWTAGAAILAMLYGIWRPLLVTTISEELAIAEGINPVRTRLIFMVLMALLIALLSLKEYAVLGHVGLGSTFLAVCYLAAIVLLRRHDGGSCCIGMRQQR